MKKLVTTTNLQSKLYPEVSYKVRTLSEGRRQQVMASVADATYTMYELVGKANALLPVEGETLDSETQWKRTALIDQINEITSREIWPAWIRTYVVSIDGLDIDGTPATVDTFLSDAPTDLFAECVNLIKGQAELSPEEKKLSE
ncbi:MAG TPA: hypothetical protein VN736_01195 [Candidatus Limnocylindrales bacterium]|nr:hypothetical protein [Candidatus Limnocylindrales bacterium]